MSFKFLFITDSRPHAHDYGVDFLIQGAYNLYGASRVYEWPEKPNLHIPISGARDECQIDSDAWLPLKGLTADHIRRMIQDGRFSHIVLTSAYGTAASWGQVCSSLPDSIPVYGLHYDDEQVDTRQILERIICRRLTAYYHRENPQGGALPLFLSQPHARIRRVDDKPCPRPRVFYRTARHRPGDPREQVAQSIINHTLLEEREVLVTKDQNSGRLLPEEYRDRLWESAISVVWNSDTGGNFPVWDSNRFWESLALGCQVVAERPLYQCPNIKGVKWIDAPDEVGPAVRELLDLTKHERVKRQHEAQADFIKRYTSEALIERIRIGGGYENSDYSYRIQ